MAWVEKVKQRHVASVKAGAEYFGNVLDAGNTIVVGGGEYENVQDAVDAAPQGTRTIIQINAGNYRSANLNSCRFTIHSF